MMLAMIQQHKFSLICAILTYCVFDFSSDKLTNFFTDFTI